MKRIIILAFIALFISVCPQAQAQTDSLDNYIARLKHSQANRGSETAFMSIGSDFMYALEYFEAGNYSSAARGFESIVRSNKNHPYANYMLAVALLKQNEPDKTTQAQAHLSTAIELIPSLKNRLNRDVPAANASVTRPEPAQKPEHKPAAKQGLDEYISQIKYSRNTGGKETVMLSAGLDAFYGIEYYEKGDYRGAETNFGLSLSKDPSNAYVNYMNAISLTAIGRAKEAEAYLAKAVAVDKSLQQRYNKEAPVAIAKWNSEQKSTVIKPAPSAKIEYGGPLKFGNYTCHVSVWNGPNVSPAYRNDYKGYFELKKDGTYRWLDDGATGRYKYDSATGKITWLSGYFKGYQLQSSLYQSAKSSSKITIRFTDTFKWDCGCQ